MVKEKKVTRKVQESALAGMSEDPKVRLEEMSERLDLYARVYCVLPKLIGTAKGYETKNTTAERFYYVELAKVLYGTLKSALDREEDSFLKEALSTFREAYPNLYGDMTKPRRK